MNSEHRAAGVSPRRQASRSGVAAASTAVLLALALATGAAAAAQASLRVRLSVNFIPTSGACGAQQAQSGFEVVCGRPVVITSPGVTSPGGFAGGGSQGSGRNVHGGRTGTGSTPAPGNADVPSVPAEGGDNVAGDGSSRSGEPGLAEAEVMPTTLLRQQGMRNYNTGEISSWRLVSLHNGAYVELTIAW